MELKHSRTSADYSRIEQLGLEMADQARQQRISAMTDFPMLSSQWRSLESICAQESYDVFKAWPRIEARALSIRRCLHWLTANNLDTPGDAYAHVAVRDAAELREKNAAYGESWKRRGGVGAFMMLARKWDRMDNILAPTNGGSHMSLLAKNPGDVLDDIGDLRRYLLLVQDEALRLGDLPHHGHDDHPSAEFLLAELVQLVGIAYVNAQPLQQQLAQWSKGYLERLRLTGPDGAAPDRSYVDQG